MAACVAEARLIGVGLSEFAHFLMGTAAVVITMGLAVLGLWLMVKIWDWL